MFRFYAIYYMRERLLTLRDRLDFIKAEPEWGPGRVDTFNPLKAYFNFPPDKLSQTGAYWHHRFPVDLEPGTARDAENEFALGRQ